MKYLSAAILSTDSLKMLKHQVLRGLHLQIVENIETKIRMEINLVALERKLMVFRLMTISKKH